MFSSQTSKRVTRIFIQMCMRVPILVLYFFPEISWSKYFESLLIPSFIVLVVYFWLFFANKLQRCILLIQIPCEPSNLPFELPTWCKSNTQKPRSVREKVCFWNFSSFWLKLCFKQIQTNTKIERPGRLEERFPIEKCNF